MVILGTNAEGWERQFPRIELNALCEMLAGKTKVFLKRRYSKVRLDSRSCDEKGIVLWFEFESDSKPLIDDDSIPYLEVWSLARAPKKRKRKLMRTARM